MLKIIFEIISIKVAIFSKRAGLEWIEEYKKLKMNKSYIFIIALVISIHGCSTTHKMKRGTVVPSEFYETISITTAKGIVLVPCEYEGKIENYYFDTGAQLTDIQRTKLKGKRVSVRGASNRSAESGTEVLKSFKIGDVDFRKTFATNTDAKGLKEQIPNFGGTLGRPIIDRANWLIDLQNKTLVISDTELSDDSFMDIPLEISPNGAPHTKVTIDDEEYRVIIDLGSTAMLNVPNDSKLASKLIAVYEFNDQERERYTVGGLQSIVQQVGIIPSIKVGEMSFEDVEVSINTSSQIRIGMNLFKNRIIYIDNTNSKYRVK